MSAADQSSLKVIRISYGERITQKSKVLHGHAQYGEPDGDLHPEYNFWVIQNRDARILPGTGAEVVPGHDGRVRDRHPALAGPASHIATVLG